MAPLSLCHLLTLCCSPSCGTRSSSCPEHDLLIALVRVCQAPLAGGLTLPDTILGACVSFCIPFLASGFLLLVLVVKLDKGQHQCFIPLVHECLFHGHQTKDSRKYGEKDLKVSQTGWDGNQDSESSFHPMIYLGPAYLDKIEVSQPHWLLPHSLVKSSP